MRKSEIFAGLLIALCLALSGGVWWSVRELKELQEEYYTLENECANHEAIISSLKERNKNLQLINIGSTEIISDAVEFYSQISRIVEDNKSEILSMNREENKITLQLQGDYYNIANIFADWRAMPFAFLMSSLTIERSQSEPKFFVDARVILELLTE